MTVPIPFKPSMSQREVHAISLGHLLGLVSLLRIERDHGGVSDETVNRLVQARDEIDAETERRRKATADSYQCDDCGFTGDLYDDFDMSGGDGDDGQGFSSRCPNVKCGSTTMPTFVKAVPDES